MMNPASSSVHLVPELKGFVLTDKLGSGTYATVYKSYKKVRLYSTLAIYLINPRRACTARVTVLSLCVRA